MSSALDRIQSEVISALNHVEAEDGLFFQNFTIVHESEERTPVRASDDELIAAPTLPRGGASKDHGSTSGFSCFTT